MGRFVQHLYWACTFPKKF